MKRFLVPFVCLSALALLFGSCILDPKEKKDDDRPPTQAFKSLKEKDHTLFNFELAYNNRDFNEYKKLTDEDESVFIFTFRQADETEVQWGRAKELEVTGRMFLRGGADPIQTMSMDFSYVEGDITWEEYTPPAGHEQENWYQKYVTYDLTVVTTGGQTYYAIDSQALFIIRYSFNSVVNDSVWQVVQYFDRGAVQ